MIALISGWLDSVRSTWVAPQEVRAEAWALGGRHRGKVLEGARLELAGNGLDARRAILLRAVIRRYKNVGDDHGAAP
jgi:hypothetical protein